MALTCHHSGLLRYQAAFCLGGLVGYPLVTGNSLKLSNYVLFRAGATACY